MRACAIVPAYDAALTVGEVVSGLLRAWPTGSPAVFVVDDGSADETASVAAKAGAEVLRHDANRGKGAALRTALRKAESAGFDVAVTVDADGQHPPEEAIRLLDPSLPEGAFVLGVRDLVEAGAPPGNIFGNRCSNYWLSLLTDLRLRDTQCGLRRYPIAPILATAPRDDGFGFEAEVILRAVQAGIQIVEIPVRAIYPPEQLRVTHFRSVLDPIRIVARIIATFLAG